MEAIVARGIQALVALGGAYAVALWFVLIVWTFRDIEARSRSVVTQVFSTLLVVLFYVPGVLLYMILRPKETLDDAFQHSLEEEYLLQDLEELPLCPACQRYVEDDFVLCPHCHATLREPCAACGRLVDLRWSLCPYCGTAQGGREAEKTEQVEAPAARWAAPALRRRRAAGEPEVQPAPVEEPVVLGEPAPRPGTVPEPDVAAASMLVGVPAQPSASTAATDEPPSTLVGAGTVRPFDRFRFRSALRRAGADANGNGNGHSAAPLFRVASEAELERGAPYVALSSRSTTRDAGLSAETRPYVADGHLGGNGNGHANGNGNGNGHGNGADGGLKDAQQETVQLNGAAKPPAPNTDPKDDDPVAVGSPAER